MVSNYKDGRNLESATSEEKILVILFANLMVFQMMKQLRCKDIYVLFMAHSVCPIMIFASRLIAVLLNKN